MRKVALQRFFTQTHSSWFFKHLRMCVHEFLFQSRISRPDYFFLRRPELGVHPTDHELFESAICRSRGTERDNILILFSSTADGDINILSHCPLFTVINCLFQLLR